MVRPKSMKTVIVIAKGNKDVEGVMVKMNALNVVVKFIQKVLPKTVVMSDNNTILIVFPDDNKGNPKWVQDNIFRFVDVLGTTNDAEAEKRALKAYDKYEVTPHMTDDGKEMVGSGTLIHYLQQFYLIEKFASVFEVPK